MAESKKGNRKKSRNHKVSQHTGHGAKRMSPPLTPVQKVLLGGGQLKTIKAAKRQDRDD